MSEISSPAAITSPDDANTSSTPEPVEMSAQNDAETSTPSAVKRSPSGVETPPTRRSGAGSIATSKPTAAASARTSGGMNKPAARAPPLASRRTSSTPGHQSQPSMSASDEEKRIGAKSATASAAARRVSSVRSSPGGGVADKKPGTATAASTVRKPTSTGGTTASPRASGTVSKPGSATTTAGARTPASRSGGAPSSSTPDARKRLSTVSLTTSSPRPSTRTSVRSEASTDAVKLVEDLTSKLADKDTEIESLRSQITGLEHAIGELREQAEAVTPNESVNQDIQRGQQQEHEEVLTKLKLEHQSTIEGFEAKTAELTEKLQAAESSLAEALRIKGEDEAALSALKESLESLKAGNEDKLRASEEVLQKALHDHATQVEELQAAMAHQKKSEQLLAELTNSHESAVADLNLRIEELTVSNAALEKSKEDAVKSEQEAHASTTTHLGAELSDLRVRLATSEETIENATRERESEKDLISKWRASIDEKEAELAEARESAATIRSKIDELQAEMAVKEDDVAKIKVMHDERMKQISQDYENEIESLRGDAFFKRKFEELERQHVELEKQHSDLKALAAEDADKHVRATASSDEEHLATVGALETKVSDYEQTLKELQDKQGDEIQQMKDRASAAEEAHAIELGALKAHHLEALQSASNDGEATLTKRIEDLEALHNTTLEELNGKFANEREGLLVSHKTELAAVKDAGSELLAAELAKLQDQLDKAVAELEDARSSSVEEINAAKHELIESHMSEVEKLIAMHTEAMESLKTEGANAKRDLEELVATHTKAIEDVMAEYNNSALDLEDKLSQQKVSNAQLQATLKETQESLDSVQMEAQDLSRRLAQEKMERITLLAELDAVKVIKPDTMAIDCLKADLVKTTKAYEETLSSMKTDLQSKQEEVNVVRGSLKEVEEKFASVSEDLESTRKSLKVIKAEAQAKEMTAETDYRDLNQSMTLLVEDANHRARDLESRLAELTKKVESGQKWQDELAKRNEELLRREEEFQKREEELLAQLRVRNAELAEEKIRVAVKPRGLAGSRFAHVDENGDLAAATGLVAEGEDDEDHSSAALALLSKVRVTTKQIDALDREMRDRNLQLLSSITDVNLSG